jgi:hypothetical protein
MMPLIGTNEKRLPDYIIICSTLTTEDCLENEIQPYKRLQATTLPDDLP